MVSVLQTNDQNLDPEDIDESMEDDDDVSSYNEAESDANFQDEIGDGNPGWANSMAQVLKSSKPKTKKSLVLSRAQKVNRIKKDRKPYDFEVVDEHDNIEEKPDKEKLDSSLNDLEDDKPKKNIKLQLRIKPTETDREHEKILRQIATKGVVQLFNAVRTQQKEIDEDLKQAGPLDHRKDAVLSNINKKKFLDVLMSGERSKSQAIDNQIKEEEIKSEDEDDDGVNDSKTKSQWSVLRDDFMTGKKTKNWDIEDEDDSDKNQTDESDDDSEESS